MTPWLHFRTLLLAAIHPTHLINTPTVIEPVVLDVHAWMDCEWGTFTRSHGGWQATPRVVQAVSFHKIIPVLNCRSLLHIFPVSHKWINFHSRQCSFKMSQNSVQFPQEILQHCNIDFNASELFGSVSVTNSTPFQWFFDDLLHHALTPNNVLVFLWLCFFAQSKARVTPVIFQTFEQGGTEMAVHLE